MPRRFYQNRKSRPMGILSALLPIIAFSMILTGFVIVFGFLLGSG